MSMTRKGRKPAAMAVAQNWRDGSPIVELHPRLRAIQWLREKIAAGDAGIDPFDAGLFILKTASFERVWGYRALELTGCVITRREDTDGGERLKAVLEADVAAELGLQADDAQLMLDEPLASRGVERAAELLMDATVEALERPRRVLPCGHFDTDEFDWCSGCTTAEPEPVSLAAMRDAKAAYDRRYPFGVDPQLAIRTTDDDEGTVA